MSIARSSPGSKAIWKLPLPVLIYLLGIVIPVKFSLGPLSLNAPRLLLLIVILPLSINLLRGTYGRILAADVLFFLYAAWMPFSLLINNPDRALEFGGSEFIEFFGGYLLARAYIRDESTFAALAYTLAFLVIATLPFALYEAVTGHPIILEFIRKLPGIQTDNTVQQELRLGFERAQVTFPHPILYGLFASLAFSIFFVGLKSKISLPLRIFGSLLVFTCVFFSLSSGALLATILQIGLILWAWMLRGVQARWYILIGILALAYVFIDILSSRTPLYVFMSYATFSPHNAYWRVLIFQYGLENVWAHPIFGLGLHTWARPYWMGSSIDNFWLLVAMRYGIPGFLLLTLGIGVMVVQISFRNIGKSPFVNDIRRAWLITFCSIAFSLSTVHVWASLYSLIFFFFGAGMWLRTYENAQVRPVGTVSSKSEIAFRRDHLVSGRTTSSKSEENTRLEDAPRSNYNYSRFGTQDHMDISVDTKTGLVDERSHSRNYKRKTGKQT